jgi:hypothetical protein
VNTIPKDLLPGSLFRFAYHPWRQPVHAEYLPGETYTLIGFGPEGEVVFLWKDRIHTKPVTELPKIYPI